VTTFAGTGSAGAQNGKATQASFNNPIGIAINSAGSLVIADQQNNSIRIITTADNISTVTTLAGTLTAGFTNSGATSTFNAPTGVAITAAGNIYVADQGNNAIRLITAAGVVSTVAGNGTAGLVNDNGAAAEFTAPTGIAVDAIGNIYVADKGNNVIRKIDPDGDVTTLAGTGKVGATNGAGAIATFNQPTAVAVDASGNVFVADFGNNLIRMITPGGVVTTLAGSGAEGSNNGKGLAASFDGPAGLAFSSSGLLYVADSGNNIIREVSSTGSVVTVAGTGTAGFSNGTSAITATFNLPQGVAINASGTIYIADTGNGLIRELQL
jgi:sugar lactone lactonase YvrE